ncbi:MAG: GatB/YqeY domain-containing protein [Candidatus Dadabacteria bacterium]|nr:GatB/YqeY domain-containing protein [Candidatus Dadabacteria bacterium]
MSLRDQIPEDIKQALRNKKSLELNVLRMLQSAIKNKEIENKGDLDDQQVIEVVSSEIKKRRDAIEEFLKVGREDAANEEKLEIDVLMNYMPRQLSEDEIKEHVINSINEVGAKSIKDLGQVMKILMPILKGKADGKLINKIVREQLENI